MSNPEIFEQVGALHDYLVEQIHQHLESIDGHCVDINVSFPIGDEEGFFHWKVITEVYLNKANEVICNYIDDFYGENEERIECYSIDELVQIVDAL